MRNANLIYLDNAATTRMHPSVFHAMEPYPLGNYFNPLFSLRPSSAGKDAA